LKTLVLIALAFSIALAPAVAAGGPGNGTGCEPKWEALTPEFEGTGTPLDGRAVEAPTGGVECW